MIKKKPETAGYPFDIQSKKILTDILKPNYIGIDSIHYRAQHEEYIELADKLVSDRFILRSDDEKYRLSFNGLMIISENKYVQELMKWCEIIFDRLRKHYQTNPRENISLIRLSAVTAIVYGDIKECLSYLKDLSILSFCSPDFYVEKDHQIRPSERILRYKRFGDILDEQDRFIKDRLTPRSNKKTMLDLGNVKEKVVFGIDTMHKEIRRKCADLYEKGHYAEAVEKSFKVVRDRLRILTGYETGAKAFGSGKLHIKGAVAAHVDGDFNEGVKFLCMAIDNFRNEKSHSSDAKKSDSVRAYEYMRLSSLAMNLLKQAIKK